jgi:hypothetical protein
LKCVHVLRKPCSEPIVAANVLRYGTGAINVDATRIHSGPSDGGNTSGKTALGQGSGWNAHNNRDTAIDRTMSSGRWPANLVLQHLDGCVQDGTKKVKVIGATAHQKDHKTHSWVAEGTQTHEHAGFRDPDGTDTVTARVCAPGCPVTGIDQQSGVLSPQGSPKKSDTRGSSFLGTGFGGAPTTFYGEAGWASRFFKQVKP